VIGENQYDQAKGCPVKRNTVKAMVENIQTYPDQQKDQEFVGERAADVLFSFKAFILSFSK